MKFEFKMAGLLRVFLVILLVIVIGVILYLNAISLGYLRSGEVEKEEILLGNMVKIWDNTLSNNKIFIDNYMSSNKTIATLNSAKTEANTLYALQDIRTDLNEFAAMNFGMQEIFFYSGKVGENGYLASYRNAGSRTTMAKYAIRDMIDKCEASNNLGIWSIEEQNNSIYLIYIVKRNEDYMGCWSSLDYLVSELVQNNSKDKGSFHFFVSNYDGECLTTGYMAGAKIDISAKEYVDKNSGIKYLQVAKGPDMMPVILVEHVEMTSMEAGVIHVRNIMIIIGIALVISLIAWSRILEYVFYRPINNLMLNMSQISEGDLDTRIEEKSKLREIRLLYKSFNEMAHEIQNLKIAIYEKEINEQKTRLEYLQVQIHPHFLVNGLNSISAMIDMNKVIPAKEMCGYLASYYRYQYSSNGSGLIPLQNEIEHVNTYIDIQKMRHPNKVEFYCEVDDYSLLTLIPPILILTFVGNSFKYGMNLTNYKNIIYLDVTTSDDFTRISIRDEGAGFSDEVLYQIENQEQIVQKERVCIGIQNAFKRLNLFYGNKASYRAYNDNGAVVEIIIPTQF